MVERGEGQFVDFPPMAATIYDRMMQAKSTQLQVKEIAQELVRCIDYDGKLLDVGTGPGRLLAEVHALNPQIQLFALDISKAMIDRAEKNLAGIPATLTVGRIQETSFDDDFFDIVTCTGSLYLWNKPEKGLDEIYRILKLGRTAYLFETYSDYDKERFEIALKSNLRKESFLRRRIMPSFLRAQLEMTYTRSEIKGIIQKSHFRESYTLLETEIAGLPIWVKIELEKIEDSMWRF